MPGENAGIGGAVNGNRLRIAMSVALAATMAGIAGFALQGQAQDNGPRVLPPAGIDFKTMSRDYNGDSAALARRQPGMRNAAKDVAITPIPILLPGNGSPVTLDGMVYYSFEGGYDINLPQNVPGLKVMLSGNDTYVAAEGAIPPVKGDRVKLDNGQVEPVIIQQSEDGWLASFTRYGVSYTAEMTCETQAAQSYCANDSYIRSVTASLTTVVVGERLQAQLGAAQQQPPVAGPPPGKLTTVPPKAITHVPFKKAVPAEQVIKP